MPYNSVEGDKLVQPLQRKEYVDCVANTPPPKKKNIYIYIQGVTGGTDQTSGGCSLC